MITWLLSPLGRIVGITLACLMLLSGTYMKGRWDQRMSDKLKIQQEIQDAVQKGHNGSADALRKFDAGKLPDSWWVD